MITELTANELASKLRAREVSAPEVTRAFLAKIEALEPRLNAFITVSAEEALQDAESAQARLDRGEEGALLGVPVAIKDILSTKGVRTTCGSKMLADYVPPFDATAVTKLREAGAILIGKTNLDEFAMGASTETSAFGATRNPWDLERSPGGSSGGSASAVAASVAPLALGTDTGGSIRQPASLCGIVGFKPTYGRVSRYGMVAFGSSLDQIGPMTRTVEDAAMLAAAISGHDPKDSTSLRQPPIGLENLKKSALPGLRFGMPQQLWSESNDAGVLARCFETVEKLKREGAEFEEISLPSIQYGVTTYYIIAPAEASSNLARFDGIRYGLRAEGAGHVEVVEKSRAAGFGHEVKARIMIGTYALSSGYYDAYYLRAQQVRSLMRREFEQAFGRVDFIVSPTSPVPAFKIGELSEDPLALKLLDYCTIPANMGGFPALSLNCGLMEGLPVGFQIIGPNLADEGVLQTAFCIENVVGASPTPSIS